jgi:hypothetical protein
VICKVDGCLKQTRSKEGYCLDHKRKRKVMLYLLAKNMPKQFQEDYSNFSYRGLEDKLLSIPQLVKAIETGRYRL